MSVPRFERDDGDELRPRGRLVPVQPNDDPAPLLIDIRVGGVTFGTVDPMRLKARAQIDLERVRGALDLLRWCVQYAGVDDTAASRDAHGRTDRDRLEDELGEMPLSAIVELASGIAGALGEAAGIPKASRRR
jgi:hypothetical protein